MRLRGCRVRRFESGIEAGRCCLVRDFGVGKVLGDDWMIVRRDQLAPVRFALDLGVRIVPDLDVRRVGRILRIELLSWLVVRARPETRVGLAVDDVFVDRHVVSRECGKAGLSEGS